jgi:hypothetical protein
LKNSLDHPLVFRRDTSRSIFLQRHQHQSWKTLIHNKTKDILLTCFHIFITILPLLATYLYFIS